MGQHVLPTRQAEVCPAKARGDTHRIAYDMQENVHLKLRICKCGLSANMFLLVSCNTVQVQEGFLLMRRYVRRKIVKIDEHV